MSIYFWSTVSLAPVVGLGLGDLGSLEHPYVFIEGMFSAALFQFLYLGHHLVQDILIVNHA